MAKMIKKAQNGTKTADSTAYFKKSADINAKVARSAAKYGDRNLSEKAMKDSYEDTRSMLRQTRKGQPGYDKNGFPLKKKMKNGGSLSALKASNKRVGSEKGAFIDVQKKALAGAKGKASLTKDKQLGATKMQNGGSVGSKVVKENPRQQKRLSRIKENNPERAERVEKRMVKRADRAMGARGAASRMKTGGKVAKKK